MRSFALLLKSIIIVDASYSLHIMVARFKRGHLIQFPPDLPPSRWHCSNRLCCYWTERTWSIYWVEKA